MKDVEQRKAAKEFAEYWKGKGYEKGESQPFWLSLLNEVYGIEKPEQFITFEEQVHLDNTSFIDGMIPSTHVMIEQKGLGKDLNKKIQQSDGTFLTPFQQAQRYSASLPYSQRPRWIITCNFESFCVYDMEHPTGEPEIILLENLEREYYRLNFLVNSKDEHLEKEMEVSIKAGEIVGKLYDALLAQYINKENESSLKSLNILCVRLVFCLYAEDAGIFGRRGMFHDYLNAFDTVHFRKALIDLFKVLDTKPADRDPYLEPELAAFPYVNGGLFANEEIEIPMFTDEIRKLLLVDASIGFDWSEISPTIFGAVFESTLNPETRRSGGMHYTSIENIHKVIDPLFLDDLRAEFEEICETTVAKTRENKLMAFQEKLASLCFLDPAAGSGNFLTETYLSLRKLENEIFSEIIKAKKGVEGQITFGYAVKVAINQFYGIEINDFAVSVAKTALWIAESQMLKKTEDIVHMSLDFLPLKSYTNIAEGNALRLNWEDVVPKNKLDYIMGNPPFVGARLMSQEQKYDLLHVFGDKWKNAGNLDYVACWYKKATDLMKGTTIRTALVSTNSVSQGEQVANLWKPLFEEGVHIDFAHRTFRWDSEATLKAHVHCVIIGFSIAPSTKAKTLFYGDREQVVKNINAYLVEADNVFVESKNKPLCSVPEIGIGNQPIDGGNYLFTEDEKNEFIAKEPLSEKWFRPWIGSQEFINRYYRYCLWLGDCPPNELRKMPECMKRVQAVMNLRMESKRVSTKKLADTPTRFQTENMPDGTSILIPETSSENRRYIPMGFVSPDILCSNAVRLIPNADLYHFGVLTSNVHMAWTRTVCGRLKSDYRYSKDIVYNNFPWPDPTPEQKAKIEQTAQAILDARALYPDCSLADLYDELTMPPELRRAHQANDKAVMQAYGFWGKLNSESACVAALMEMYKDLISGAKK